MDRRRASVLSALAARPGERIVEIGCGGGLLLRELARSVAPTGTVVGVDLSSDQIDAARHACADAPNARAEVGSATALAAEDGSFDASVSTQVIEYIEDAHGAVAELGRVTRIGGRLLNVATNWDSLIVAGGDAELTERIVAAWDRHAPHPNLPVGLPGLFRDAGYSAVTQTPLPLVNRTFNRATWAFGIARLMAAFASSTDDLDDAASARWLSSLDDAAGRDELFVSAMPIMTVAPRCRPPGR